jgi:hypothetical protein
MDVRVQTALPRHTKVRKLIRRLGAQGMVSLLWLWLYAADSRQTGVLVGMTAEDIELAAEWPGESGQFVAVLKELRWLDEDDSGALSLHDWADWQPWIVHAPERSESARVAATARWEDAARMHTASAAHPRRMRLLRKRNAPSPSPNLSLAIQEEKTAAPAPAAAANGNGKAPEVEAVKPEDLLEGWNEHCTPLGLSRVKELTATRRKHALLRLHEHPKPEFWETVFGGIRTSPFLKGLGKPRKEGEKAFRVSFDWLLENDTNAVKIFEGKYNG